MRTHTHKPALPLSLPLPLLTHAPPTSTPLVLTFNLVKLNQVVFLPPPLSLSLGCHRSLFLCRTLSFTFCFPFVVCSVGLARAMTEKDCIGQTYKQQAEGFGSAVDIVFFYGLCYNPFPADERLFVLSTKHLRSSEFLSKCWYSYRQPPTSIFLKGEQVGEVFRTKL